MPWFVAAADLLASEYGWPRREIWEEIPMPEVALYLRAITVRRLTENGQEDDLPTDTSIIDLLELIDKIKLERKRGDLKKRY